LLYLISSLSLVVLVFTGCSTKQSYDYYEPPREVYKKAPIVSSKNMHRATMRPYTVNGKTYYPTVVSVGETFRGIASWYGRDFHGKKTSNGEYYNMYDMTAAHKTLPMNTILKVTNLNNGKSEIVRINDRGPFVKNRIIDLSYVAAKRLGVVKSGTAPVRLEVLGFDNIISTMNEKAPSSVTLRNFAVQIGSFRRQSGANIYKNRYANVDNRYKAIVKEFMMDGKPIYRVWLSGFESEEEARDFVGQGRFDGAFVVRE